MGPTRSQAQGKRVRRTSHGYYLPAEVTDDVVEQRIVEASVLVPRSCGAITGWAALRWHGSSWFDGIGTTGGRLPVPVISSTFDRRPHPSVLRSGEGLDPRHVEWVDDIPVTDAVFSVAWEMRHAVTVRDAVIALEMACYDDLVSVAEVAAYLTPGCNGWTGVPRARRAVDLARENSWSPTESSMRWVWEQDGGRGPTLANAPVFDPAGHHLFTPDLLDPVTGVAGEYEGEGHLDRARRDDDVQREAKVRRAGLELVTMTAPDFRDPGRFLGRLAEAYERSSSDGSWTLTPPGWWVPTTTVEQRRALTEGQRERWLRRGRRAA